MKDLFVMTCLLLNSGTSRNRRKDKGNIENDDVVPAND